MSNTETETPVAFYIMDLDTGCFLLNFLEQLLYLFIFGHTGSLFAAHGLSLAAVSRGYSSLQFIGSLWWLLVVASLGAHRL